jgi:hypothetical protein
MVDTLPLVSTFLFEEKKSVIKEEERRLFTEVALEEQVQNKP